MNIAQAIHQLTGSGVEAGLEEVRSAAKKSMGGAASRLKWLSRINRALLEEAPNQAFIVFTIPGFKFENALGELAAEKGYTKAACEGEPLTSVLPFGVRLRIARYLYAASEGREATGEIIGDEGHAYIVRSLPVRDGFGPPEYGVLHLIDIEGMARYLDSHSKHLQRVFQNGEATD